MFYDCTKYNSIYNDLHDAMVVFHCSEEMVLECFTQICVQDKVSSIIIMFIIYH